MYVCPNCKSELRANFCRECGFETRLVNGLPAFFTGSEVSNRYAEIGAFYDDLYETTEDAWNELAARGPDFVKFVALLVMQNRPARYLDVGCGEGYLLSAVSAPEKYGLDISRKALLAAGSRSGAVLCLGFAEQLPYPSEYFDAISSIGVTTHLIDDLAGTREIHRVLCANGRYVAGIYVPPRRSERIRAKILEFAYPRPKPFDFIRWTIIKGCRMFRDTSKGQLGKQEQQPVRRYYTTELIEELFIRAGFVIEKLITKMRNPQAPLPGAHFRVYVLRKKAV